MENDYCEFTLNSDKAKETDEVVLMPPDMDELIQKLPTIASKYEGLNEKEKKNILEIQENIKKEKDQLLNGTEFLNKLEKNSFLIIEDAVKKIRKVLKKDDKDISVEELLYLEEILIEMRRKTAFDNIRDAKIDIGNKLPFVRSIISSLCQQYAFPDALTYADASKEDFLNGLRKTTDPASREMRYICTYFIEHSKNRIH